ncbi:uncharacterized protein STEHIDRAFT_120014 [Stereum hirsutum FP-91666 SS1]|uniref:uncharacterized protein n=1 Tax=Stereum hirsutum (strain FP-91666) TaxID=721885 RepID=UPI000440E059|nr:uncharacterized protein STEHIDRAFT_120014 [Stereum hirsutum FP-91666 SS1]EIM89371.1 hypothetical protein STEHIDRAFT_120014 [Stereum hirsutum FP-91666 SS1]
MAPVFSKVVRSIPRLPLPRRSSSGSKERERVGRRKALLIGINYQWGEEHEYFGRLQGSIRDVQGLKDVLIRYLGFEEADIVVMTDEKLEDRASDTWPSKDNIVAQMQSLVQDSQSEDVFVFHYAGHTDQREVPSPEDHHEESTYNIRHSHTRQAPPRPDEIRHCGRCLPTVAYLVAACSRLTTNSV